MSEEQSDKEQTIAALRADLSALRDNEVKMRKRIKELEASSGGHEEALARARAEGAAEKEQQLSSGHNRALNEAEIRARAARSFADPDDAVRFLDLEKLGANSGRIEAGALEEAMAAILEAKPYLAAKQGAAGGGSEAKPPPAEPPAANGQAARVQGDGGGGPRSAGHGTSEALMNEAIRKAAHR